MKTTDGTDINLNNKLFKPVIRFNHILPKKDVLIMLSNIIKKYDIIKNIKGVNSTSPKIYYNINLKTVISKDIFENIINDIKELFDETSRNQIIFNYKEGIEPVKKYTYSNYKTVRYLEFINETHWRSDDD